MKPMHCNVCGETQCSACGATKGGFVHVYQGEDVCYGCAGYLRQEGVMAERKRIIAKLREKAATYMDDKSVGALEGFADELEAENGR